TSAANPVELQLKRANGSLATVEVVGRPTIAGTRPPSRSAEWQFTVRDVSALRTAREQLVRVSAAAPANHTLRISLFGAKLERDGEPIRLTPREIELLAFLAVRADPSLTAVLTATIWPDLGDRAGANALHVTVSRVRHKVVGVPIVTFGDAGYALDSRVAVDVRELQRAVAELGRTSPTSADLARYEPLRAEVARRIPDQLAHHEWFAPHAVLLERLRRDLFVRLARCALAKRTLDRALEFANELIRLDPTDETAYGVAIEVHLAQGDEAAAYRAYRDCRRVLSAELGVEPSEAIRDRLGATIQMGRLGA
ncbi:MAG: AfsR/SARP family transcriptional regulator, partial [Candidatus Dormibacteria bacterium]